MGLDMYLNAKRFLWHSESELADKLTENFPELGGAKVKEVIAEAMYWRKSNAIHKWFVDNVQNGEDDCGNYDVSREQLQALVGVIIACETAHMVMQLQQDVSPTPAPPSGVCENCEGRGYVGDGTVRVPCQPCGGTGKR